MRVDFAGHLDGDVIAIVATAQRPAKRIGLLLGAGLAIPSGPATLLALPRHHALLLHLLSQILRATA